MTRVNPVLFELAQQRVWKQATLEKRAIVPPDPSGAGGAPGGAPPPGGMPPGGAPTPGGMPPGMDPSMGGMPQPGMPPPGGMPPGGAPPAGGMPPGAPMDPTMQAAMATPGMMPMPGQMPQAAPQKIKPEQWMQMLDFRLYNMQQQITAIMNSMQINLPPGVLVMPPGTPASPPPESAVPGGPNDPAQQQGPQPQGPGASGGPGGDQSAIQPIDPMQAASPDLAQQGKTASVIDAPVQQLGVPFGTPKQAGMPTKVAALSALLQSRKLHK